jgi:uncharacterized membrane protein YeaQ/YmgE (transglycosylase-associated protein family)
MKRLTVTKISLGPYVKWAVISYFIVGLFTGISQGIIGYAYLGGDLTSYLFWYVLGLPLVYLVVGVVGGTILKFLYNTFNHSFGSYSFDVEEAVFNDHAPPPPPDEFPD